LEKVRCSPSPADDLVLDTAGADTLDYSRSTGFRRKGRRLMQSRTMSLIEALANVLVGYGVAVTTQAVVFPLFGLHASLDQNLAIGLIFTGVSLVRSYVLRRLFNSVAWSKFPEWSGRRFHYSGREQ
ncbi:MAG: hypothetical protein ACKOJB_05400, partial [Chthoniobacterales bacterium]